MVVLFFYMVHMVSHWLRESFQAKITFWFKFVSVGKQNRYKKKKPDSGPWSAAPALMRPRIVLCARRLSLPDQSALCEKKNRLSASKLKGRGGKKQNQCLKILPPFMSQDENIQLLICVLQNNSNFRSFDRDGNVMWSFTFLLFLLLTFISKRRQTTSFIWHPSFTHIVGQAFFL